LELLNLDLQRQDEEGDENMERARDIWEAARVRYYLQGQQRVVVESFRAWDLDRVLVWFLAMCYCAFVNHQTKSQTYE
jgi:hypothetical protein